MSFVYVLTNPAIPGVWLGIRSVILPPARRTNAEVVAIILAAAISVIVAARVLTARPAG